MTRALVAAICMLTMALLPAIAYGDGDGRNGRIAWTRFTPGGEPSNQLVTARPDGSDLRVLTQSPLRAFDVDPMWSPDGSRLLFQREWADGPVQIVVIDADGRNERAVEFGCTDPCLSDQGPTWTPDGRHIAFTRVVGPIEAPRSAALWIGKDDGTRARRLSPLDIDGTYEDVRALWSRDRTYIQFLRLRSEPPSAIGAVFRMRPDGTGARQLTPWEIDADMSDLSRAAYGPTKDLVVFETFGHGGAAQNIATVPATCPTLAICTKRIRYLTANAPDGLSNSTNPAWAPDGSRIAVAEWTFPAPDDTSTDWYADIFTFDANGRDRRRVSTSTDWDMRPNWGVTPRRGARPFEAKLSERD